MELWLKIVKWNEVLAEYEERKSVNIINKFLSKKLLFPELEKIKLT